MFQIHPTDTVGIIGLGYVGLPLAVAFGKTCPTIGFDIQTARIEELKRGSDKTLEVTTEELAQAGGLTYTTNPEDLARCRVFIVTVPTPINQYKQPDLEPLIQASKTLSLIHI